MHGDFERRMRNQVISLKKATQPILSRKLPSLVDLILSIWFKIETNTESAAKVFCFLDHSLCDRKKLS